MRIVVTGADGFIGKNLRVRLREQGYADVQYVTREVGADVLRRAIVEAEFVFHLAGVNRPQTDSEFETGNVEFTKWICDALSTTGRKVPVVFSSSTQIERDNAYGRSKRLAEEILLEYARRTGAKVSLFRLPNVFGKWCRPNYNSVVATFCHNIARGLPIAINDPGTQLRLVHIDVVADALIAQISGDAPAGLVDVAPVYETTVGDLARTLFEFAESRASLITGEVGLGFKRALYATYVSYLPSQSFSYALPLHGDHRGAFVEMLKTPDCGQFSYFTAHPGITRGEHYHHSKTEKFLVIRGTARFSFRHIVTGERHEEFVRGEEPRVVETVPGWTHNITNVGTDELIVMLWANELFDRERPDTVAMKVDP